MPSKQFDDRGGAYQVEFRLPPESSAQRAWLAGDFNDWSLDACPLERRDDGALSVSVLLEPGRTYRFRYYLGDGEWENDWAADDYVGNDHGGADSVVHVPPAPAEPPPTKKAAAKKPAATRKKAAVTKATTKKAVPPG